jgi:hypothetical protein
MGAHLSMRRLYGMMVMVFRRATGLKGLRKMADSMSFDDHDLLQH